VILAVPVAAADTAREISPMVDDLVCIEMPTMMMGVGASYRDFRQSTDAEVRQLLVGLAESPVSTAYELEFDVGDAVLPGTLSVPSSARGVVLFAHGSGSSRHSPRNRWVAERLEDAGLATLLFDLLTAVEGSDRSLVFDIPLLGRRLAAVHDSLTSHTAIAGFPAGYFGSSTGAAAALVAASGREDVAAIVSRGGRPDLAAATFEGVRAPVLLIVGGNDAVVLDLNRAARVGLPPPSEMEVIPGAGHLFEEPGTLDRVCESAADWFRRWMS
jgi:putative phosphoribosyl transferase